LWNKERNINFHLKLMLRRKASCVLYYNTAWKGRRGALPFHPSGGWRDAGTQSVPNFHTIRTYRRFTTRNGSLRRSPYNPIDKRRLCSPFEPIKQDLGELTLPPAPNPCINGWPFNHHLGGIPKLLLKIIEIKQ
jgi:hypothetical protein